MSQKSTNCSSMLEKFKDDLRKLVESQFSEADSQKILALINSDNAKLVEDAGQKLVENKVNREIALPVVDIDVCKLPKFEGNCTNSVERYYYDPLSERCLIFAYSGCNGNANNFETLELCQNKCKTKTTKIIEPQTPLAANRDYLVRPKINQA